MGLTTQIGVGVAEVFWIRAGVLCTRVEVIGMVARVFGERMGEELTGLYNVNGGPLSRDIATFSTTSRALAIGFISASSIAAAMIG